MSQMIHLILSLTVSYLLGSIPTAYIFGKLLKGIDIRKHGSGNVGATNVFRVLGQGPGIVVLLIDIAKGLIAVVACAGLFKLTQTIHYVLSGLAVVAGHNWTCFLKFKGGKGMATSLGVLIGLMIKLSSIRVTVLSCAGLWTLLFLLTGYVSLASILSAVVLPVLMVVTAQSFELVILGLVFCVFVILRHRSNIKRLLNGQEHRFSPFKKRPS